MKTSWATVEASHDLKANAGEQLDAIIRDSLGHELGKKALEGVAIQSREVPVYDAEGKVLAVVTQFFVYLHTVTDADLAATVRLWRAAKAIKDGLAERGGILVPEDPLLVDLLEAIK